jgi:hypothetical protein
MNRPAKDPRDLRPDLDLELASFLMRAVERDPRERFQSAREFREALLDLPEQGY